MTTGKDLSLGELEALYHQKIQSLSQERAEIVKRLGACDQQLKTFQEKLRWVRTLISAPNSGTPPAPRRKKRRRKSPVKDATLKVLRNRPGQWLTARQIKAAIRKDTHKRASRQSVNVNLNQLEQDQLVRRRPAPPGSGGARFVYSAA